MKKLIYFVVSLVVAASLWSCNDDDSKSTWDKYKEWREANKSWFAEQENLKNPDGTYYYTRVTPAWNPGATILIHWFNDRSETQGNLMPMLTSTVMTYYKGRLYNDELFDSTAVGESFITRVSGVVDGWQIALMNMHVGDTVEIAMPYQQGYGSNNNGVIPPYSALKFNIRLVDIPAYEIRN